MASLRTQIVSSSSSSSIPQWKYDVFLSFKGEDTRKNFTDHLYAALDRNGIYTFRDDQKLEKSKPIAPELFKAIENSKFSIIIFSRTYASSKWCLDELVKIVECKNNMGQKVVPVFYEVDPFEVRNQAGHFQEAFAHYEEEFRDNQEKVQRWRAAMKEVGNLSGFHLKERHESEFVQDIVQEISSKLSHSLSSVVNEFVGMDKRLEDLNLNVDLGLKDVQFVGIYGMGGIGKTTLARVVYSQMSCHFDGSSFLADVRELSQKDGLVSLQEKLLSQILMKRSFKIWDVNYGINMIRSRLCHKKVLVVIDDVDHINQIEVLAGNRDWFGLGSRIIITTRDEHLLNAHGVNVVYPVEALDDDEALQLFSFKAFKKDHPPTDYVELSRHFVIYADGLPLALKVFGSFLSGRGIDIWKSALERVKEDSGKEILDRLRISYDGLEEIDKKIFLDVAYFFKGKDKDYVIKILDSCHFQPEFGIDVLIRKCLITISCNQLWMHDLLQEMAKKIVQDESPKELGKRSRLWGEEEVYHVLTKNLGTEAVEGIIHNFSEEKEVPLSAKAFSNMSKLRVLQICNVKLPQGLDLSNELRFLEWYRYPLKSLPSSFHPDKIVVLNLCYSRIQQLWKEIKPLNKLKFINLSHSKNLTKIPNFTWIPNLESLILEGCTKLSELHSSFGDLKRLLVLNLKDCKNLSSLPSFNKLESLEVCTLAGCSKLEKFPEIVGEMKSLKTLDLSGIAIGQFPPSFFMSMKNLKELSFRGCKGPPHKSWSFFQLMKRRRLDPMPLRLPSLTGLHCLKKLDLSDCNLLEGAIPNDLGGLSSLKELNLSKNNFVSLPTSINQLLKLSRLYLNNCNRLKSLPVLPSNISSIEVFNCTSMEILPDALKSLSCAPNSDLFGSFRGFNCFNLVENEGDSNLVLAWMKKCFRRNGQWRYQMVVPGSEIPKWFSHHSERASTRIARTAVFNDSDDEKVIGLVVCCVFVHREHLPRYGHWNRLISCDILSLDSDLYREGDDVDWAMSDHLWLQFVPYNDIFCTEPFDKNQFRVGFNNLFPQIEVTKFGIRLIYKHDVEEFSHFENFDGLHQDFDKSTMDGAKVEKLNDYYAYGYRNRKFGISLTNCIGAVWEDL